MNDENGPEPGAQGTPSALDGQDKKKEKKKRPRGFAGMISGILSRVNNNERFKEKFKDLGSFRFLIVATDFPPAGLVKIDNGILEVENVPIEDVKNTPRDGLIQGIVDNILAITKAKSTSDILKLWVRRKIKLRGLKSLLKLNIAFYYAGKEMKKEADQAKAAAAGSA